MPRERKSPLERNLTRIFAFELQSDKKGEMIVYCDYWRHKGIVGNGKAKECVARKCNYVRLFREEYK